MSKHQANIKEGEEKRKRKEPDPLTFIRVNHDLMKIDFRDISLISAVGSYAAIHISRKKYVLAITLEKLLLKLPKNDFVRIHRTYAVRIDKIDRIKNNNVCFVGKRKIPIARRMWTSVKNRLVIIEALKS